MGRTPTARTVRRLIQTKLMPDSSGILLLDKPAGPTSHDIVRQVRAATGTRRVGHAGTLDPPATGLMLVGVNRGTKLLHFLTGLPKVYEATLRLGASTSTDDATGQVLENVGSPDFTITQIEAALENFRGQIQQVPAKVSAIKVGGKRAHQMVRDGEGFTLPPRPVTIFDFSVTGAPVRAGKNLDVPVLISCSAGTYIRSLARDLGEELGVGGHVASLRRTRVGPWDVVGATAAEKLSGELELRGITDVCLTLYEGVAVTDREAEGLRYGQAPQSLNTDTWPEGEIRAAVDPRGNVAALLIRKDGRLKPAFVTEPI